MGKTVGRNDPCPCGSGKKFKRCCIGVQDPPGAAPCDVTVFDAYDELATCALSMVTPDGEQALGDPMVEFFALQPGVSLRQLDACKVFALDLFLSAARPRGRLHEPFLAQLRDRLPPAPRTLLDRWRATPLLLWQMFDDQTVRASFGPDTARRAVAGGWGEQAEWVVGWMVQWGGEHFLSCTVAVSDDTAADIRGIVDSIRVEVGSRQWFDPVEVEEVIVDCVFAEIEDLTFADDFLDHGADPSLDADHYDDEWDDYYRAVGYLELMDMVMDSVSLAANGESPLGSELDEFRRLVVMGYRERGVDAVDKMLARHGLTPQGEWNFEVPAPAQFPVSVLGLPPRSLEALGLTPQAPLSALEARCDGSEAEVADARAALRGWIARNRWLGWTRRQPGGRVDYTEVRSAIDRLFPAIRSTPCVSLCVSSGSRKRLASGWRSAELPAPETVGDLPTRLRVLKSLQGVGRTTIDDLAAALLAAFEQAHGAGASVGSEAQLDAARDQIDDGLTELARLFET